MGTRVPGPTPHWLGATAVIAGALTAASITWSAAIPGGNTVLGFATAAGIVTLVLTVAPLVIAAARRRRASPSALVAIAVVALSIVGAATSAPTLAAAAAVAPTLEAARATASCPETAGVFRIVDCLDADDGTLYLVDGAGALSTAGYAVFDEPLAGVDEVDTPVTLTLASFGGLVVSVWPLTGRLYAFELHMGDVTDTVDVTAASGQSGHS